MILNVMKPKPTPNSPASRPPTVGEQDIEKASQQPQEPEIPGEEMSKGILDPASTLRFLLGATEDEELLEVGPSGALLVEAKKELQRNARRRRPKQAIGLRNEHASTGAPYCKDPETPNKTPATMITSSKLCDELDNITQSLNQPQTRTEQTESGEEDSGRPLLDINSPMNKIMPVENLSDFKKIISQRELPTVASYLSDDEPSRAVDDAMKQLVKKYHEKAAFISVDSKFRDIAIGSKIKSYPSILIFRNGKMITEMKSFEFGQLDRELSAILEPASVATGEEDSQRSSAQLKKDYGGEPEMKQDSEIQKLQVADSP
jgi:hypothetical protein